MNGTSRSADRPGSRIESGSVIGGTIARTGEQAMPSPRRPLRLRAGGIDSRGRHGRSKQRDMASDPSDWDPLPEVGAAQHPGEAATFGPPLPAAAAGASAAPLGALPAGGLLRGLQLDGRQAALPTVMQRSGSAGRTEPRQREPMQRSESRVPRIVARAPAPRPAPPVPPPAAPKAAPAQPPAPAMVLPAIEIDPREQEPWF